MNGSAGLTATGVACVGIAYGMARYGFGLLLPDMRATLQLSDSTIGATAAAYLIASLRTGSLVARFGPRAIVLAGGACAVTGMLLAGAAPSAPVLAVAVAVAGASSALVYPPFADAITAVVPGPGRARALAWTSSGTGAGVAVAAPLALVAGDWRLATGAYSPSLAFSRCCWRRASSRPRRSDHATTPTLRTAAGRPAPFRCWLPPSWSASAPPSSGRGRSTASPPTATSVQTRRRHCSRSSASPAWAARWQPTWSLGSVYASERSPAALCSRRP